MFPISFKREWQNSAPEENPQVQGIKFFSFKVASTGMIFNQDIATIALSITILEGLADTFSNSSKGLLNSWSFTTPIRYSVVTRETHCGKFSGYVFTSLRKNPSPMLSGKG